MWTDQEVPGPATGPRAAGPAGRIETDADGCVAAADGPVALLLGPPEAGCLLFELVPEPEREAWRALAVLAARGVHPPPLTTRIGAAGVRVQVARRGGFGDSPLRLAWTLAPPAQSNGDEPPDAPDLRPVVDDLAAVVWEEDPGTGGLRFVSRSVERMLGHPRRRWLDDPGFWPGLVHPVDRAMFDSLRRRQRDERSDLDMDYRLAAADGRYVWVRELSGYGPSRGAAGLRGTLVNISRRKRAERRLQYTRSEAETQVRDLSYLQDLCLRLSHADDLPAVLGEAVGGLTSLLGAPLASVCLYDPGRHTLRVAATAGLDGRLRDGQELPLATSACGRAVVDRRTVVVDDVAAADPPVTHAAGARAFASAPLVTLTGDVVGTLTVYYDEPFRPGDRQVELMEVYARHAAQVIDAARRHDEAREAARQKDEFLATIGHELRNPLAAIAAAVRLVEGPAADTGSEPARLAVDVLRRQTAQMTRLVDDLLDVGRIEHGLVELRPRPVDPAEAVSRAVEAVRPRLDACRHRLDLHFPATPLQVQADPDRLAQVVTNLLGNAARFTAPGGAVRVTVARRGGRAVIAVADNGVGIDPALLPRIFEPFARAGSTDAYGHRGLGIGLTLVQRLVKLHGGSVLVTSPGPGLGSEVVVSLPLADLAAPPPPPAAAPIASGPAAPRRVLVVDDDADSTALLLRILTGWGHRVRAAHSAADALEAVRTDPPDVVLLDLGLPDRHGLEVIGPLREAARRPIRVVAVTGYARPEDQRRSEQAGFDAHFAKPVDLDALRDGLVGNAPAPQET